MVAQGEEVCRPVVFQRRCYIVTSRYVTLSLRGKELLRPCDQSAVAAHLTFPASLLLFVVRESNLRLRADERSPASRKRMRIGAVASSSP